MRCPVSRHPDRSVGFSIFPYIHTGMLPCLPQREQQNFRIQVQDETAKHAGCSSRDLPCATSGSRGTTRNSDKVTRGSRSGSGYARSLAACCLTCNIAPTPDWWHPFIHSFTWFVRCYGPTYPELLGLHPTAADLGPIVAPAEAVTECLRGASGGNTTIHKKSKHKFHGMCN